MSKGETPNDLEAHSLRIESSIRKRPDHDARTETPRAFMSPYVFPSAYPVQKPFQIYFAIGSRTSWRTTARGTKRGNSPARMKSARRRVSCARNAQGSNTWVFFAI